MPRKPISFELDFMIKDIFPRFTVKQFDDVSFNIKPKNQGLDYDTTGMTGKIFVGVNDDMFMQTTGIIVSSDNINVLLDKNMLQKNGRAYAEIELTDNVGTITSSSFIFDIDPKIGEGGQIPGEYEGFVEKYERLISEFKSQVSSTINNCNDKVNITINNCNTNVDNKLNSVDSLVNVKISDFEKRFNRLTSSQQQDAEVIDARVDFKGVAFDSLKERIDYTDKLLRDSTVSTVTTESDFTTVEATSNGYFEDVKLEGKTLVNLFRFKDFTVLNEVNLYAVCSDTKDNNITSNRTFTFKNTTSRSLTIDISENGKWKRGIVLSPNKQVVITTTPTEYVTYIYGVGTQGWDVNSEAHKQELKNACVLLEGDHTQNPPSYFEGLKSVGQSASEDGVDEIVVSSVGKNIFSGNILIGRYDETGNFVNDDRMYATSKFKIQANKTIVVNHDNIKTIWMNFWDVNMNHISQVQVNPYNNITTPINCVMCSITSSIDATLTNLQVEYGTISTPYVPHQSDKKRLLYYNNETQAWEKPILRQWDSIEKHADGKYYYHQRSGEVVLNGNEGEKWVKNVGLSNGNYAFMHLQGQHIKPTNSMIDFICDKLVVGDYNVASGECISKYTNGTEIVIKVTASKLSTQDVQGFKQWLQANNVTVVYQLAQEKVYECTNIDLITYANETNYIVESGAIVPRTTLKVHNNISNVVSLLQKKVSLLESNITSYMITQNRLMLASRYNADTVSFKVDVATLRNSFEYDNDLYELILNNILVGKDNYNREYIENLIIFYWMDFVISDEMYSTLFEIIEEQHNPKIIEEETPLI